MLLSIMWLVVAAVMFVVVAAAMRIQNDTLCAGYDINIISLEKGNEFTSKENIEALVKRAANGNVKGQKLSSFNLLQMEELLEQSPWVLDAELYIDNLHKLQIKIKERIPLIRIFTTHHESFYMDGLGRMIPLSDEVTMDVPVFTGYVNKKVMQHSDSVLVQNMIATANFVSKDSFWNAQVSEINIASCGKDCWEMFMIPVVGNHKVLLGDGSDITSKFHRLYLFYDQVLKNIGFDKYKTIDVQYANQVVAVKGENNKIDSIALRKNISELLEQVRNMNDAIEDAAAVPVGERYKLDSTKIDGDTISMAVSAVAAIPKTVKAGAMDHSKSIDKTEVKKESTKKEVVPAKPAVKKVVKSSETNNIGSAKKTNSTAVKNIKAREKEPVVSGTKKTVNVLEKKATPKKPELPKTTAKAKAPSKATVSKNTEKPKTSHNQKEAKVVNKTTKVVTKKVDKKS